MSAIISSSSDGILYQIRRKKVYHFFRPCNASRSSQNSRLIARHNCWEAVAFGNSHNHWPLFMHSCRRICGVHYIDTGFGETYVSSPDGHWTQSWVCSHGPNPPGYAFADVLSLCASRFLAISIPSFYTRYTWFKLFYIECDCGTSSN